MKKRVKKLWLKALRSGQYEQGRKTLRTTDDKFCCLGVLCNLHAQAHPRLAKVQDNPTSYFGEESFLPDEVAEWAGLNYADPEVRYLDSNTTLAVVNDEGVSFKRIANIIEKQL